MRSLQKIFALAVMVLIAPASFADDAPANYVGVFGSYFYPDGASRAKSGPGAQVLYGSPINNWLSVELNAYGHQLRAKTGGARESVYGAGIDLRLTYWRTRYFDLISFGGLGANYQNFYTSGNKGVAPFVDLGTGIVVPIAPNLNLRAELRTYALLSSQIVPHRAAVLNGRGNLGVEYSFGGDEPAHIAAPPPPPELVKVVDLDTDGDGVLDSLDLCPNTPPGTSVDERGCPIVVAAPIPVPIADTDGDGVPDNIDQCPRTAPGLSVDATGCAIKQTLILRNINFDFDSGAIREDSKRVLDPLAETMLAQPSMTVEIDGHADSIGKAEYNLALSQARAKLVRLYLKSKGVKFERMSVDGFGEFKPIADNNTEEGRALNRRVEFKVLTP